MPKIPAVVDEADRVEYVTEHYWDGYIKDAAGIDSLTLEQAVANYAVLLGSRPIETGSRIAMTLGLKLSASWSADSSAVAVKVLPDVLERYFYDPNSPLRDEDLWGPMALGLSRCGYFSEAKRSSLENTAARCSLNSRGSIAADFVFLDSRARRHTLHGIKAQRTVLFFSNPGCKACKEIIDALSGTPQIASRIADGSIAVLNIYIDEDLAAWRGYMSIYPKEWYNGFDPDGVIRSDELYCVRAIPSLYLLDASKKVLLKDAPLEKLISNL